MSLGSLLKNIPFELEREIVKRWNTFFKLRPSSKPFLSGDTFRAISDFLYDNTHLCTHEEINLAAIDTPTVFVSSYLLSDFSAKVLPFIEKEIILLTHQGDVNITNDDFFKSIAENHKIKKWFAQNCTLQQEKVIPLPIGLEDRWRHNAGAIADFKNKKYKKMKKLPNILYGFSINTNPPKRVACYLALSKKKNTHEVYNNLNSHLYRKLLSKFMFVASPEGNGLDCHRTWEAMYFDVVPIVERNYMTEYFASLGLPIWIIDDWNEVTELSEEKLSERYFNIIEKSNPEGLWLDFWVKEMVK
ncbi:MAG: hypothetical protein K5930_07720 [Treponemataceae bacterium]|nr:hypothetical protein [Treponemataceae bacterium]